MSRLRDANPTATGDDSRRRQHHGVRLQRPAALTAAAQQEQEAGVTQRGRDRVHSAPCRVGAADRVRSDQVAAQRAFGRAKQLREALHAVLTSGAPSALAAITEAYVSALRHRELRPVDDGVAWVEREKTVRGPVDRLTAEAVALITGMPLSRVKQCDDAACGWLFLDSSHRQNRRWCSAADCGNRDRARRHYERSRG